MRRLSLWRRAARLLPLLRLVLRLGPARRFRRRGLLPWRRSLVSLGGAAIYRGAASIDASPLVAPALSRIGGSFRLAFVRHLLDVAPVLELLDLVVGHAESILQAVDFSPSGIVGFVAAFYIILEVICSGGERVDELGQESAT